MIVETKFPSGAIEISTIVGNQLVRRTYFSYTKTGAIREFKREIETIKKSNKR